MANAPKESAQVVYLEANPKPQGHRVGTIARFDGTQLWIDFNGNAHGPIPAQSTIQLAPSTIEQAIADERPVLLAFLEDCSHQPVIIGLLHNTVVAETEADDVIDRRPSAPEPLSCSVDGRRLTLEAQDEVVIRCGEASITLRRNGRLSIRGVYVESRARGTHRIKGGSVQIN